MKEIVLGPFIHQGFLTERGVDSYPFMRTLENFPYASVLELVERAVNTANIIHFVLNGINPPFISMSGRELELIMSKEEYLNKTIFYKNEKVITYEEARVFYKNSGDQ